MCYHLKTRAGISEFNFLDSGFWAPQKVDKKSWPTVTKWSSATLYLRSSAPLAYIKRKRGRKQHEVTAKIQILLSKTQHLCISLRLRYHRTSRSCLQRDQALFYRLCCVAPPCFFHRSPEWRVKKGTFIWLQSATKSCTPDLYKDHVGGCSLCHCWTVLRSTEWCFYYSGYPFFN